MPSRFDEDIETVTNDYGSDNVDPIGDLFNFVRVFLLAIPILLIYFCCNLEFFKALLSNR